MRRSLLPLLAMAASMGVGMPTLPGDRSRRTKRASGPAPNAADECVRIVQAHGPLLRHRITGEVRHVRVWTSDSSVWFTIGTRQVHRKARKALDWLRHAEAAGGAS